MCQVAEDMQRIGKCIVIGLQSTGEARTIEAVEVSAPHIILVTAPKNFITNPDTILVMNSDLPQLMICHKT